MHKKRYVFLLALLPFIVIVVMYEITPLIMLIVDSFHLDKKPDVVFSLENYRKIVSTLSYIKAIDNSIKITLISTFFGIVIAFLGAKAAHNSHGFFRNGFITVLMVCLINHC